MSKFVTKDRIAKARVFLGHWKELRDEDRCNRVAWLMLKFSCKEREAWALLDAVNSEDTDGPTLQPIPPRA